MKYSTLFLLLTLVLHLTASQNDTKRCKSAENSPITKPCEVFYSVFEVSDVTYYEEEMIPGLRKALNDSYNFLPYLLNTSESSHQYQCTELIGIYLCNYYFPFCRMDRDGFEILPVCSCSCNLLYNNEECSNMFIYTLSYLGEQGISVLPDNNSCEMTYRPIGADHPGESNFCFSIEEYLTEPFPLNCKELPEEDFCFTLLPSNHFAPGTSEISANPSDLNDEISQINELMEFTTCGELLNTLNCLVKYPACSADTKKLIPICDTQCLLIDVQIKQCLINLEDKFPGSDFPLVKNLLRSIECDEAETYYNFPFQYIEANSTNCLMLTLANGSDTNSTNNPDDNSKESTDIIIGVVIAVVVAVALVTAIIVIIHLVRKKGTLTNEIRALESQKSEMSLRYVSTPRGQSISQSSINTEGSLDYHRASIQLQIDQLLFQVKERFSEVLLPAESITKLELSGKGKFGVVHKGRLVADDGNFKLVAIKTIKSGSVDAIKDLITESAIMKTFDHPNVLPLLGICIDYNDEDILKVVIPFMANGDLRNFLKNDRVAPNNTCEYPENLSEGLLKRMCFDIAKGMEYLAERRFIHRDLAARNCMVDERLSIKVADFGLTRDVYSTEYYRVEQHIMLPVKWMSLESLMDGYFNEKTDVWSFGVTCWEIFSLGRIPYPGVDNAKVISLLKSGKRLEQPYLCPPDFYEMIKSTWKEEPEKRPSFSDIVQFFRAQNIDSEDTLIDKTDSIIVDNDSGYLDIFQSETVINNS